MPVRGVQRRQRPPYVVRSQPRLNLRIIENVELIVVLHEIVTANIEEDEGRAQYEGGRHQHDCQPLVSAIRRLRERHTVLCLCPARDWKERYFDSTSNFAGVRPASVTSAEILLWLLKRAGR